MFEKIKFPTNFVIERRITGIKMLLCIMMSSLAFQPDVAYSDDGFYFGIGLANVAIGGDFNGSGRLESEGVVLLAPDVDDAVGTKFILGLRGGQIVWEGSITVSDHDASFGPISTPAEFFSLNFDAKYLFNHRDPTSLYGVLGIGLTTLTISNGACNISGNFLLCNSDAEYGGLDFRFGGGLELQLANKLAVSFQILQRFGGYDTAEGKGVSGTINDSIDGDGLTLSAEIKYTFAE